MTISHFHQGIHPSLFNLRPLFINVMGGNLLCLLMCLHPLLVIAELKPTGTTVQMCLQVQSLAQQAAIFSQRRTKV